MAGIARITGIVAGALLAGTAAAGCVAYSYEKEITGSIGPYELADRLEEGRSTLADALNLLGSPDLLLRVKESRLDRAYYTRGISSAHRIILTVFIPFAQNLPSIELAVLTFSNERLWLVRLDADASGVLKSVTRDYIERDGSGQYFGISGAVVSTYLEDRERSLLVEDESLEPDEDDDDDEDEARPPESGSEEPEETPKR